MQSKWLTISKCDVGTERTEIDLNDGLPVGCSDKGIADELRPSLRVINRAISKDAVVKNRSRSKKE